MTPTLPTGRNGRMLAVGVTVLALASLWFGLAAPLMAWHAERAATLAQRSALADRMAALVRQIPALRQQAAADKSNGEAADLLLAGASDALAGAALQGKMQDMAGRSGVIVSSIETLPAEQAGQQRRIALRVSVNGPWAAMVALLRAVDQATPAIVVDELQMHGPAPGANASAAAIDAVFIAAAFRDMQPAPESAAPGQAAP